MNRIKQHVSSFIEAEPITICFESFEDLLVEGWIAYWANHPKFHRFSIATEEKYLMVELDRGCKWYVIGYLDHVEGLSLHEWEPA